MTYEEGSLHTELHLVRRHAAAETNDFGELLCGACGVTLTCDDFGDMPLVCPECGAELKYINKKEG